MVPRERSPRGVTIMALHQLGANGLAAEGFPDLLTADQVADLPGVSAATINRWGALRDHGEDIGPPCYSLSRSRTALGRRRSAQMDSPGSPINGGFSSARYP